MQGVTRVVLAEDEVLLREGLVALLARFGFDVLDAVGTAPRSWTPSGPTGRTWW
ncbi:hypothetical protein GCM10029963_43470 [Micromonospora andamanensis]